MKRISQLVCALSVLSFAPVLAHHNEANTYTRGQPILWEGKVTRVSWDGAHVMYQVDIANAEGVTESWQVLGGSPYRLARRGIHKKTVSAGASVTVAGYLNANSRIVTPVYLLPSTGDAAANKLFVGYVADDASFDKATFRSPR